MVNRHHTTTELFPITESNKIDEEELGILKEINPRKDTFFVVYVLLLVTVWLTVILPIGNYLLHRMKEKRLKVCMELRELRIQREAEEAKIAAATTEQRFMLPPNTSMPCEGQMGAVTVLPPTSENKAVYADLMLKHTLRELGMGNEFMQTGDGAIERNIVSSFQQQIQQQPPPPSQQQ